MKRRWMMAALPIVGFLAAVLAAVAGQKSANARDTSAPTTSTVVVAGSGKETKVEQKTEYAIFGAGCFWGVESAFRKVKGVVKTEVGYAGGKTENPTYKQVCTDTTGHAEVVRVEYDPQQVTYEQLLDIFWKVHDPTTLNRQGPDIGSQYRSAVYFTTPEQETVARASKEKRDKAAVFARPIVTEIQPAGHFYRAEEYHQQYLEKRGVDHCH